MKKADVQVGSTYAVKVSGRLAPVTITGIASMGGWWARNERTGRAILVRSAQRLRYQVVEERRPRSNGVGTYRVWVPAGEE